MLIDSNVIIYAAQPHHIDLRQFIDEITLSVSVVSYWDNEAQVFYAESDIEGLHIEAASLDEFEEIMLDTAPELIMVNHWIAAKACPVVILYGSMPQ